MTEVKSFDRIVEAGYVYSKTELSDWLEQKSIYDQPEKNDRSNFDSADKM